MSSAPILSNENKQPCPEGDQEMDAIRGSKEAVCENCGFKDSCCY